MLEHLIKSAELDSVSEYIERYIRPLDVTLDNGKRRFRLASSHFDVEIVWPHPVRLFPYD